MGFSGQEYWSGLPFSPPGDLPDPGIKPTVSCIDRCVLYQWATREARTLLSLALYHTGLSLNISVKCLKLSQHLLLGLPPAPSYSWFSQLIQLIWADPRAGQNRCHPQPQTTGLEWEVASHHFKWIAFYLQPIFGGKKNDFYILLQPGGFFNLIPMKFLIFLEKRLFPFRGNSGD